MPQDLRLVNNVLLILGVAALMAIVTAVLAYFVDIIPSAIGGSGTRVTSNAIVSAAIWPQNAG